MFSTSNDVANYLSLMVMDEFKASLSIYHLSVALN